MTANIPVPSGPRAPINLRWLWWVGPPALITFLYRTLLPPKLRRLWCPPGNSTSHEALANILAGHGWFAFFLFALPRKSTGAFRFEWPLSTFLSRTPWFHYEGILPGLDTHGWKKVPYPPLPGARMDQPEFPFSWFPIDRPGTSAPWPLIPAHMLERP
jgi:hypothetical protein